MNSQLIDDSRVFVKDFFNKNYDEKLAYHNLEHTERVFNQAYQLGLDAELEDSDLEVLLLAALFHDTGYVKSQQGHEEISGEIAKEYLRGEGVSEEKIEKTSSLILATKMDWIGNDHLAFILRDADLSNLAAENYLDICERLRVEINNIYQKQKSKEEWLNENIAFFKEHKYLSKEGKKKYNKAKKKNLQLLNKMLGVGDTESTQTIASSKSAQTQLKTSLRNHIDLSAIADNKANIMLSVNAMVLTVGLPLLLSRLTEFPQLLVPTLILAAASIVSMIYATLATRPIGMMGKTDISLVSQKKTNLFFFGNFYKMSFDEYEDGITKVISDNELLDNSITRDLFFLGKSLGKKYDYLRICYNVFMYGVGIAVVGGIITFTVIS